MLLAISFASILAAIGLGFNLRHDKNDVPKLLGIIFFVLSSLFFLINS